MNELTHTTRAEDLIALTFPNGKDYAFVELDPRPNGDRVFETREKPPKGQRWNLRSVPNGAPVGIDGTLYSKVGATGRTIRLRPLEQ